MNASRYGKGRYVTINPDHPSAVGVCDSSGLVFNHKDLVQQMEWRGDSLVWTGFLIGRPFLDQPQQQNRPPLVKPDPRAIINPRLPQDYISVAGQPTSSPSERLDELNNSTWEQVVDYEI